MVLCALLQFILTLVSQIGKCSKYWAYKITKCKLFFSWSGSQCTVLVRTIKFRDSKQLLLMTFAFSYVMIIDWRMKPELPRPLWDMLEWVYFILIAWGYILILCVMYICGCLGTRHEPRPSTWKCLTGTRCTWLCDIGIRLQGSLRAIYADITSS